MSALDSSGNRRELAIGDVVRVWDGSKKNGAKGRVWRIQENRVILVELDGAEIWPAYAHELEFLSRPDEIIPKDPPPFASASFTSPRKAKA